MRSTAAAAASRTASSSDSAWPPRPEAPEDELCSRRCRRGTRLESRSRACVGECVRARPVTAWSARGSTGDARALCHAAACASPRAAGRVARMYWDRLSVRPARRQASLSAWDQFRGPEDSGRELSMSARCWSMCSDEAPAAAHSSSARRAPASPAAGLKCETRRVRASEVPAARLGRSRAMPRCSAGVAARAGDDKRLSAVATRSAARLVVGSGPSTCTSPSMCTSPPPSARAAEASVCTRSTWTRSSTCSAQLAVEAAGAALARDGRAPPSPPPSAGGAPSPPRLAGVPLLSAPAPAGPVAGWSAGALGLGTGSAGAPA
mmetsp:Transcript_24125/g.65308  ORF Transcript_24125/g.65308 Transcript_24125/m.65308 type:complete len:321 (+) Transcript_24125:760-1722(+)